MLLKCQAFFLKDVNTFSVVDRLTLKNARFNMPCVKSWFIMTWDPSDINTWPHKNQDVSGSNPT